MKNTFLILIPFIFLVSSVNSQEDTLWNQKDSNGEKKGKWRAYHKNGKLRYTGQFLNDKPFDVFRYFFDTGDLQSVLTFQEPNKASARLFYQTGDLMAEGLYLNQKREGKWIKYGAENIKVEEGEYQNGERVGSWKTFFNNGAVSSEMNFDNGIKDGEMMFYYDNGNVKQEAFYFNGKLNGSCIFYKPDGKKILEGNYVNDLRDKKWTYFGEDSQIEQVLEYQEGILLNPDVLKSINYEKDPFKDNIKDVLEFDDLRGNIRYE